MQSLPGMLDPTSIDRPHPRLLRYYVLASLLSGPAMPIVLFNLYLRYVTLRYKFDADGVSMSYGVFFRREVNLTYRRLQDIHVTRNLLQRWMGLATISLQTASGNAGAELTIEGILEADALRDFLYARMRGARDDHADGREVVLAAVQSATGAMGLAGAPGRPSCEATTSPALQTLIEIRDALQVLVNRSGAAK